MKFKEFTSKEQVLEIIQKTSSKSDFLKYIGYKKNGGNERSLSNLGKKFNINFNELYKVKRTREEYSKNPNYCQYCGKELTFEQRNNKFCSSSCSTTFNNLRKSKQKDSNNLKIDKEISSHNKKEEREVDLISRFENGENFLKGKCSIPAFIRRYFMTKYNSQCSKCGWSEMNPITQKVPLAIHHIDGDCTNNRINNLQLLCPNCHSLTENFGNLNKNSKRFHRQKLN